MSFRLFRALTWQTLTLVTTTWAIASHLSDIETNVAPRHSAHEQSPNDDATIADDWDDEDDDDAPVIPRKAHLPFGAADRDCRSFRSQKDAQTFMENSEGDPHRLDGDNDGVACERRR